MHNALLERPDTEALGQAIPNHLGTLQESAYRPDATTHWLALPEDASPATAYEGWGLPLITPGEMQGDRLSSHAIHTAPAIGRAAVVGRVDSPLAEYPRYTTVAVRPGEVSPGSAQVEPYTGRHRTEE